MLVNCFDPYSSDAHRRAINRHYAFVVVLLIDRIRHRILFDFSPFFSKLVFIGFVESRCGSLI